MPTILNASACPAPQVLTSFGSLLTAFSQGSAFALPTGKQITGSAITPAFSANALETELVATFGGGGVGLAYGLALSAGTGLSLTVSAGLVCIGGLREIAAASLTVPVSSSRVWIWLSQSGALSFAITTASPGAAYALLGSCVT